MGKKQKIIYVDDINLDKIMVRDMLKNYYDVFIVDSFKNLFNAIHYIWPDLILLGIKTPGIDELLSFKEGCYAEIPFVMLTYETVDCASKPFSGNFLLETIENEIREHSHKARAA